MASSELSKDRLEEMKIWPEKIKDIHGKICKLKAYISRVPQEIRKQNESAYTPRLVSIGPLHRINSTDKHQQYSHMEDIKRSFVYELHDHVANQLKNVDEDHLAEKLKGLKDVDARRLARKLQDGEHATELLLWTCLEQMERFWKEEAKSYYPEEANEAVTAEMLVIDGCFIIQLLHKWTWGKEEGEEDAEQTQSSTFKLISDYPMRKVSVFRDLLLLENQLPFFVLDNLFCLTLGLLPDDKHSPLGRYILDCFCQTLIIGSECTKPKDQHSIDVENKQKCDYVHMLHVLHHHYLARNPPPDKKTADVDDDDKFVPSASDLDGAAVKFVVPEDKLTVNFVHQRPCCHRARFEIPTLSIDDNTEAVFRNFIAFEQCSPGGSHGYLITSYAVLMDQLVTTGADAQVLEEAKVIENYLGSRDDVPLLFNNICKDVSLDDSDNIFLQQCKEAAKYNKNHRSAWLLVIAQYFQRRWSATPYTFIAFVAAFLVFAVQVAGFVINLTRI